MKNIFDPNFKIFNEYKNILKQFNLILIYLCLEDGFNIFAKNGSHTNGSSNRKALDPKAFCDSIYMRLMNVLFVIADEKQAAATQQQFERLVQKLENETMDKK